MPTYREDIHLGHEVSTIETDDIGIGAITAEKMADGSISTSALQDKCVTEPKIDDDAVSTRTIEDGAVTEPKLGDDSVSHRAIHPNAVEGDSIKPDSVESKHMKDGAVDTRNIKDKAVTPSKRSSNFDNVVVMPYVKSLDDKYNTVTKELDGKYHSISEELYSMIASLQVGGIALSQQFGNRTDIGISQRTLTKAIGKLWDVIGEIQGKEYMDYTLTVQPTALYTEGASNVSLKADCSGSISDFDSIKVYVNGVLRAESRDITVYETTLEITEDSLIRVEGIILGKPIIKEQSVSKLYPFFMGSGLAYTDIMNAECQKEMHGSLEGDYDVVVRNTNDYIFIIIPISHKEEFRRAKLDMNGFEIPLDVTETPDYIICQTLNRYQAGEYNIDIDINS